MLDREKLIMELQRAAQDLYRVACVVRTYCESEEIIEEINNLQPLAKQIEHLSDIVHVGLCILADGKDPDGDESEEPFSLYS